MLGIQWRSNAGIQMVKNRQPAKWFGIESMNECLFLFSTNTIMNENTIV